MAENNVKNEFFTWQSCASAQNRGYHKNGGIK